jgi:16S rRNA processing protein RimM
VTDRVLVGRVGRSHGLHGAFVVERPSDAPERFAAGATVLVAGEPATVVESKVSGGRRVIRLDRRVERGAAIEVERASLPEPEEDAYYVFQLVGLAVEEEGGRELGRVAAVEPGVANDVLELDSGLVLPMVEDCVRDVDLEAGRVLIAPGFAEPG